VAEKKTGQKQFFFQGSGLMQVLKFLNFLFKKQKPGGVDRRALGECSK
jgi:hypothetical protein